MRVHCALVLHLYNKSDIPEKSVQSIWRISTANQGLSLLIFQEQVLYQLSGGRDIYSDVSKKTAGEEGRGLHECHLLKKPYFSWSYSWKDDRGITLFSLKNLILTTPYLFGEVIWTQAFSNQYMNSDISVDYFAKVKNVDFLPCLYWKIPPCFESFVLLLWYTCLNDLWVSLCRVGAFDVKPV